MRPLATKSASGPRGRRGPLRPGDVLAHAVGLTTRRHAAAVMLLCLAGPLLAAQPAVHAAAPLSLGSFAIVPGESSIKFFVPDTRGGFTGHTTQVTGSITVLRRHDGAYAAEVAASVDARTLTTDNRMRDASMHSTFLRTAQHPAITFAGTVTAEPPSAAGSFRAAAQGHLTILGVTHPQTFSATAAALGHEYVADATGTLRMADYGIPYPRAFFFVARDPVTVTLHVVARRPSAGVPQPSRAH